MITDPASNLRVQGAVHDLSRAILKFSETQLLVRWTSPRHEDMMGQALTHILEAQKYLRHIVEDLRSERASD